jgi:hypothetical protein
MSTDNISRLRIIEEMIVGATLDADARRLASVSITRRQAADLIASISAVLADLIETEEYALWTKDDGEPQEGAR